MIAVRVVCLVWLKPNDDNEWSYYDGGRPGGLCRLFIVDDAWWTAYIFWGGFVCKGVLPPTEESVGGERMNYGTKDVMIIICFGVVFK